MTVSAKSNTHADVVLRKSPRRKKASPARFCPPGPVGTKPSTAGKPPKYFVPSPDRHPILCEAHAMVGQLVFQDGPYRRKLLDLAAESIENFHRNPTNPRSSLRSSLVVKEAWNHLHYAWCPTRNHRVKTDREIAFGCVGTVRETPVPVIAFSEAFQKNDPGPKTGRQNPGTGDRKTLLLFFRMIKREFLHLVQGCLEIRYQKTFRAAECPEKYKPHGGSGVGDHDEEEDAGGCLRPFFANQKLSKKNLLCLVSNDKYLPLSNPQVEALLDLELYQSRAGMEGQAHGPFWTPDQSRARKNKPKVFPKDFYRDGDGSWYSFSWFIACGPRSVRGVTLNKFQANGPARQLGTCVWRETK